MIEVPFALRRAAPKIGCRSVAMPGKGNVDISIEERSLVLSISMKSLPVVSFAPWNNRRDR